MARSFDGWSTANTCGSKPPNKQNYFLRNLQPADFSGFFFVDFVRLPSPNRDILGRLQRISGKPAFLPAAHGALAGSADY
jgi:hypothetical protein